MDNAIIIGGTGMLAAAAREVAKRTRLTLLARSPEKLAMEIGARPFSMDWTRKDSVLNALAVLREQEAPNLMISWIHDGGLWCLSEFEALLAPGARSIRIHGSAAGDPRNGIKTDPIPPRHVMRQDIVLGWMNEKQGRRWLTDHEISNGVIEVYNNPQQLACIVGELT